MATIWMEKSLAFSLSRQQTAVLMTPISSSIFNIGVPVFSSTTFSSIEYFSLGLVPSFRLDTSRLYCIMPPYSRSFPCMEATCYHAIKN